MFIYCRRGFYPPWVGQNNQLLTQPERSWDKRSPVQVPYMHDVGDQTRTGVFNARLGKVSQRVVNLLWNFTSALALPAYSIAQVKFSTVGSGYEHEHFGIHSELIIVCLN
uniref:Uncharacterized protein n=1 Tax=Cacopsylla melanoneura TaxID=428564 RepID=A0A8D8V3D7_9HEMI